MLSSEARAKKSEIKSHNQKVENEYKRLQFEYSQEMRNNEEKAKQIAKTKVLGEFCKWIKEFPNDDYIVFSNSDVASEIRGLNDKRILISSIFSFDGVVDYLYKKLIKEFRCQENYEYKLVSTTSQGVTIGGEVTGYSISGNSGVGYTAYANTRDSEYMAIYNLDTQNYSGTAEARIYALRVQKGKAQEVFDSLQLIDKNQLDYNSAKKNNNGSVSNVTKPLIVAYNWVYLLSVILLFGVIATILISFGQVKEQWAEFLNLQLNILTLTSYALLIFASVLFLGAFIALIVLRCIINKRKNNFYWHDTKRLLCLIIALMFTVISISLCGWCEVAEVSSVILVSIIAATMIIGAVICAVYFIIGLVHIIFNPNYRNLKHLNKELSNFIKSDTYKKCCNAEKVLQNYIR